MDNMKYEAEVITHFVDCVERTGNWFVGVNFEVEGHQLLGKIWITGDSDPKKKANRMRMARASLKAIGFDPDNQDIQSLDDNKTMLSGNRCNVTIEESEWQGKVSTRIKWINAFVEPLDYGEIDRGLREVGSKSPEEEKGENEIPF